MRWWLVLAGFLAVLSSTDCGSTKTVGSKTIETNALHNTVKVSSKEGTAIIGKGAVNEKELGLPIYPGAISAQTGALATSNAQGRSHEVSLTTKDSFAQVYEWYRRQLPAGSEQTHMDVVGGSIASFLVGTNAADQKSVLISQSKDTTTILLTHITKNT